MKTLIPGHKYLIKNFESGVSHQTIQFIHKEKTDSGGFAMICDGTTNEELLEVLIDRLTFLQNKLACKENAVALTHIETALLWLEKRTRDRQAREVEGTPNA